MVKIKSPLGSLLFLGAFILIFKLGLSKLPHICVVEKTFGIHCPFCGLTLAFEELMRGNLRTALLTNPLSIGLPLYFLSDFLGSYLDKLSLVRISNQLFGIIVLINLIYLNY